jgi:hypothetical protein
VYQEGNPVYRTFILYALPRQAAAKQQNNKNSEALLHCVKIRETILFSRFITNILVGACGVPHFCTEEKNRLHPKPKKNPKS